MKTAEIPQDAVRSCIKTYLHVNGISHQELADKTGYSVNYINSCLSNLNITTRAIKKFAEALDYPYDLLVAGRQYYGENAIERLEQRIQRLEELVSRLMPTEG